MDTERANLKKCPRSIRRIVELPEHDGNAAVRLKNLRQSARAARFYVAWRIFGLAKVVVSLRRDE
jgi:hypothetical protein